MIPKKIHYFWFGGNPLPEAVQACMRSWETFLPDYEIVRWDESNFDVNSCDYAKEAYEAKKWAFVSDYARFKVLHEEGGLYFDTDVEIVKPMDDIIARGSFMAREDRECRTPRVAPGLCMGTEPGMEIYQKMLDIYHSTHFINQDGSLNQRTVVSYVSEILIEHGLKGDYEIQTVLDTVIYPWDYFCPQDGRTLKMEITPNTHAIHHFAATWVDGSAKFRNKLKKLLGPKLCGLIVRIMDSREKKQ